MADLEDGESIEMQGSGAKPYVLKNSGGVYSCSCPAWRNQSNPVEQRSCKHLRKLRGEDAEATRTGAGGAAQKLVREAATATASQEAPAPVTELSPIEKEALAKVFALLSQAFLEATSSDYTLPRPKPYHRLGEAADDYMLWLYPESEPREPSLDAYYSTDMFRLSEYLLGRLKGSNRFSLAPLAGAEWLTMASLIREAKINEEWWEDIALEYVTFDQAQEDNITNYIWLNVTDESKRLARLIFKSGGREGRAYLAALERVAGKMWVPMKWCLGYFIKRCREIGKATAATLEVPEWPDDSNTRDDEETQPVKPTKPVNNLTQVELAVLRRIFSLAIECWSDERNQKEAGESSSCRWPETRAIKAALAHHRSSESSKPVIMETKSGIPHYSPMANWVLRYLEGRLFGYQGFSTAPLVRDELGLLVVALSGRLDAGPYGYTDFKHDLSDVKDNPSAYIELEVSEEFKAFGKQAYAYFAQRDRSFRRIVTDGEALQGNGFMLPQSVTMS